MATDENNSAPVQLETKTKETGFFKRFRRRFFSIFQRRASRKHSQPESCVPVTNETSQKPDNNSEFQVSLKDVEENKNGEIPGNDAVPDSNFRPVAKVSVLENDFTAELKKSLMLRSRMVEDGQKSEAIAQIEKVKDIGHPINHRTENQTETERKTFEEKLALFESQISGNSLRNSLTKEDRTGDNKLDVILKSNDNCIDGTEEEKEEVNIESHTHMETNNNLFENSNCAETEISITNHLENQKKDESIEFVENKTIVDHEIPVLEIANDEEKRIDNDYDIAERQNTDDCQDLKKIDMQMDKETSDKNEITDSLKPITEDSNNENNEHEEHNKSDSIDQNFEVKNTENVENN